MQQDQLNKVLREALRLCISGWKPTTKTNTAEDDHTADSLTASLIPTQALLEGHRYSSVIT